MPVRMQMRVCRPAYTVCDPFIKLDCFKKNKKHPSLAFFCFHHLLIIYLHRSHSISIHHSLSLSLINMFFPLSTCYRPSATFLFCLELPSFYDSKDTAEHLQRLKVFIPFILLSFTPSANSIPHLSAQTSRWEYLAVLLTIKCLNSLSLTRVQTAGG